MNCLRGSGFAKPSKESISSCCRNAVSGPILALCCAQTLYAVITYKNLSPFILNFDPHHRPIFRKAWMNSTTLPDQSPCINWAHPPGRAGCSELNLFLATLHLLIGKALLSAMRSLFRRWRNLQLMLVCTKVAISYSMVCIVWRIVLTLFVPCDKPKLLTFWK